MSGGSCLLLSPNKSLHMLANFQILAAEDNTDEIVDHHGLRHWTAVLHIVLSLLK